MLVSPPSSVDVKSEHRIQAPTFVQPQDYKLPNCSDRQFPISSCNPHFTHEHNVDSGFNWDANLNSEAFGHHVRVTSGNMDRKPVASAQTTDLCTSQPSTSSASPPSPDCYLINNPGSTGSHSVASEFHRNIHLSGGDATVRPAKRPYPLTLSQIEIKGPAKYCCVSAPLPVKSSPATDGRNCYTEDIDKSEDVKGLPPIITREEHENDILSSGVKVLVDAPTASLGQNRCHSNADSEEALDNSSLSQKPTDASSNHSPRLERGPSQSPGAQQVHRLTVPLPNSSQSFFAGEQYGRSDRQTHSEAPHSATAATFCSAQQSPHPSQMGNSSGCLFALPSPVSQRANFQGAQSDRVSYPDSPTLTMSTPNSATFPPQSNTPFGHVSPPVGSVPVQATQLAPPAKRRMPLSPSSAPSSTVAVANVSQWAAVENQAPRRRGKLPQAVTCILKTWLMAHTGHPYPTEEEKKLLCEETNLTMNQVSNWFINARRRILVPPTGNNAVHEIRQPVRRQAQSQLARAAANAGVPALMLRRHPQPVAGAPLASPPLFSPISATSPGVIGGATFDFQYSMPHPSQPHDHGFPSPTFNGYRSSPSINYGPGPWPNPAYPPRSSTHPPPHPYGNVGGHHGGPTAYYSAPHSPYPHYSNSHSASSTPLPSPHYPPPHFGCSPQYSAHPPRMQSPHPHQESHPSTPTDSCTPSRPPRPVSTYVSETSSPKP